MKNGKSISAGHADFLHKSKAFSIILGLLGIAAGVARADIDIVHYKFPASWNGSGTAVTDQSSARNDGTVTGGTASLSSTLPSGGTGSSLSLHSTGTASSANGGIKTIATQLLSNLNVVRYGGYQFTATFMWNGSSGGWTTEKIIDYAGTESLQLSTTSGNTSTAQLQFLTGGGTNTANVVALTYGISANTWYTVKGRFDVTQQNMDGTVNGTLSLYVNGTLVGQTPATKGNSTDRANYDGDFLNRPIGIGELAYPGNANTLVAFNGLIYEAIISLVSTSTSTVDNAQLVSVSVPDGATVQPRTIFKQTWTLKNTGNSIWRSGRSYTFNLISADCLGAVPLVNANGSSMRNLPSATLDGGANVGPGGQGKFSMTLIAPEAPGTYCDLFQMNNSSGVYFGPGFTARIVVPKTGSTNQFDRARAVSYANNDAAYVCADGYFWAGSDVDTITNIGFGAPVPTWVVGDDCAHFVSTCIGSYSGARGGGLTIPSRVPPTYGEPAATRIVTTVLINGGWAKEVSSVNELLPGDVIGWNWEGDTSINNLDHVTLYLGNGLVAAHATSHLDYSVAGYFGSKTVAHYIHIFDAPTLAATPMSGGKLVLSWGANWSSYSLYSANSLSPGSAWTKVTTTPTKVGSSNFVTNAPGAGAKFFRLVMPAS